MKRFLTLAFAIVMVLSVCAFALELDVAENAAEAAVEDTAALAYAVANPSEDVHASYGKLVYYQDFEGSDKSPTYIDPILTANSTGSWDYKFANCTGSVTTDPVNTDSGNQVALIKGTGSNGYARLVISPKLRNVYGTYTVVMDFYYPSGIGTVNVDCMPYLNSTQRRGFFASYTTAGSWVNDSKGGLVFDIVAEGHQAPTSNIGSEFTEIYLLNNKSKVPATDYLYIDNVKIYYKEKVQLIYDHSMLPEDVASTKAAYGYLVPGSNLPTLTALGYHFLGWTLDETPGEDSEFITIVPEEAATLYAVWRAYKPGLNPMTGTTAVVDFEDGSTHRVTVPYNGGAEVSVVDNAVENAGNTVGEEDTDTSHVNTTKVFKSIGKYSSGSASAYRSLYLPVGFEANRKYELQYDVYFSKANTAMTTWHYGVFTSTSTPTAIASVDKTLSNSAPWINTNKEGKWYHFKYTFQPSISYVERLYLQQKVYSDFNASSEYRALCDKTTDENGNTTYTLKEGITTSSDEYKAAQAAHAETCISPIYYDNISYLPYYIITFYNDDGSVYTTAQALRDSNGNLLTHYTVPAATVLADTATKKFIGWSTVQGSSKPELVIALENEDISLYPVWADYTSIFEANKFSAKEGNTHTLTTASDITAVEVVSTGSTEAEVTYDVEANTVTVATAGYAGEITLNVTTADGEASETIYLFSGNKFKPGLDVVTGTTEPFTFDNMTLSEVKLAYAAGSGYRLTGNKADENDINNSNVAIAAMSNYALLRWATVLDPAMALERPVKVSYDYYGKANNNWIMVNNNSGANDIYKSVDNMSTNTAAWKHFSNNTPIALSSAVKNTHSETGIKFMGVEVGGFTLTNIYTVDNLSFIPYYEVKYVDIDGTETVEYVLQDADGNLLTEYTPDASKLASGASAYTLSEGGEAISFADNKAIALANEDIVIYAYQEADAPVTDETAEVRFDTDDNGDVSSAIRFKASVTAVQKSEANEYGFLVTRKTFLDKMTEKAASDDTLETELTFDFKYNDTDLFASGAAYALDESGNEIVNKVVNENENGDIIFATALTGIKNDDELHVNETFVVRPYIKYANGDNEFVFYGATAASSLVDAAKGVDTAGLHPNAKANIEAIIALENTAE